MAKQSVSRLRLTLVYAKYLKVNKGGTYLIQQLWSLNPVLKLKEYNILKKWDSISEHMRKNRS